MYQAAWRKVNDWIRQPGHFDYVVHFNKVTADPSDPSRFAPSLDSGDHLHPNPAGYKVMADAFNLKWFEESSSR
jgi:lysophospholipase L1-like esterase